MRRLKTVLVLVLMLLSSFAVLVPASTGEAPMDLHATTDRIVLVELFTGAGCGPCVNVDHGLDSFVDDHTRTEAVALVYHRSIPSNDLLETSDTTSRHQNFYDRGYQATPTYTVDGTIGMIGGVGSAQTCENWFTSQYTTRRASKSPLSITVEGDLKPNLTGTVYTNVTALGTPTLTNLYVHTVVVRKTVSGYNGGNGITVHNWVVRNMLPSVNGDSISISSGDVKTFQYNIDLSSDSYADYDDMALVAFVQTHNRQAVTVTNPASGGQYPLYAAEVVQATYGGFNMVPNIPPVLSLGHAVVPQGATEDDTVRFRVKYQDIDNTAGLDPEAKVIYKNGTTGTPMEGKLTPEPGEPPYTEGKWMKYDAKLAPGTYYFKFNATDGEDYAGGFIDWNMTGFTILPRNKPPQLREVYPTYDPLVGDTETTFRFQVQYRDLDGDAPGDKLIVINDEEHAMSTDATGNWDQWQTFYYDTELPVGTSHRFYFSFTDGEDSVRYPLVTASPNRILGPDVEKPNTVPVLSSALFSPNEGTRLDTFTFSVMYTDADNDHPTMSYIYIDGTPSIMSTGGSSYSSGVTYSYTTPLGLGPHTISFMFEDGKDEVRYPATGTIDGPMVNNLNPEAVIANPVDQRRYTPEEYIPFSAQGTEDPEGDEMFYKWTSSIDGLLDSLSAFDTTLSEGEHLITLEVTDSEDGVTTTTVTIIVEAMEAHPYVVGIDVNNNDPVEGDMVVFSAKLTNDGEAGATGLPVRWLVDGVMLKEDVTSVDMNAERTITYAWTAVAGEHTVRLEITGDREDITVSVRQNSVPVSEPEIVNPTEDGSYKAGEEIYFKAMASDANGDNLEYSWNFGDGTPPVTQENPSHIFADPGEYLVTVTITDARGGETEESFTVVIKAAGSDGDESPGFGAALAAVAAISAMAAVAVRRRRD